MTAATCMHDDGRIGRGKRQAVGFSLPLRSPLGRVHRARNTPTKAAGEGSTAASRLGSRMAMGQRKPPGKGCVPAGAARGICPLSRQPSSWTHATTHTPAPNPTWKAFATFVGSARTSLSSCAPLSRSVSHSGRTKYWPAGHMGGGVHMGAQPARAWLGGRACASADALPSGRQALDTGCSGLGSLIWQLHPDEDAMSSHQGCARLGTARREPLLRARVLQMGFPQWGGPVGGGGMGRRGVGWFVGCLHQLAREAIGLSRDPSIAQQHAHVCQEGISFAIRKAGERASAGCHATGWGGGTGSRSAPCARQGRAGSGGRWCGGGAATLRWPS